MSIVLSLDIGTSKIAAVAFDCETRQLVEVVTAVNSATVSGLAPGRHEQDAAPIYDICLQLLRQLIGCGAFPAAAVRTIAISGQMHGVLLVDRELRPLTNLITWCDQRASELTARINRGSWPTDRTGCFLHPGYGGATLAVWADQNAIPAGSTALTIADFVAAKLSGVIATDASHAASWGIMDIRKACWDREIIDRLGIPLAILPEIKPGLSELGKLRVDLGLASTVTVRLPLGDNQASFIGTCGLANDAMLLNLGTGGQISLPCPNFNFRPELETRPLPFGGYLLVGASLCGGRSYAHLKDFFKHTIQSFTGQTMADEALYAAMNRLAESIGAELTVDTRFAGTRMHPDARGEVSGIGINNFTPAALARGFVRGMVRELTGMVDRNTAEKFKEVLISGNAIRKNPLAQQFITEELGLPCVPADHREEAATGAALAAAHAAGLL